MLPFINGFLVVLASLSGLTCARGQANSPSEYQLKAVFLFNFAEFIDWPEKSFASSQSPFAVCVIGHDPFGNSLNEYLLGKSIDDRFVQIFRFPNANNLTEARRCQIIFVSASEKRHFRGVIESFRGVNALLVGDADGFAALGGTAEFTVEDNRVQFMINTDATNRADLKLSSKLLALAKIVHDGPKNGKS